MKKTMTLLVSLFALHYAAYTQSLKWAKQMGGNDVDEARSVAVDNAGNVYTTGYFKDTADFDPGPGTYQLIAKGTQDIFVSKLDASGNFVWAKQFKGTGRGSCVTLDMAGNIYTTGYFEDTVDFDPGVGTYNLVSKGESDAYVVKLSSAGNLVWAKEAGGKGYDFGYSVVWSTAGVVTTGIFEDSADFYPGAGTLNLTALNSDIFVFKLDAQGNYGWVKQFRGISASLASPEAMTVDPNGNLYITGYFGGNVDFDPGTLTFSMSDLGSGDMFVAKLDALGGFVWAKAIGGPNYNIGKAIAIDADRNVYTTGYIEGTCDFNPAAATFNLTSAGGRDAFVCKLDASGNFAWAKHFPGTGMSEGRGIAVDDKGKVFSVGYFEGTVDFDPDAATSNLVGIGYWDIYISKLEATTGKFVWAKHLAGTNVNEGNAIAINSTGDVYTAGHFGGVMDFDPDAGVTNLTAAFSDIFVQKLSQCNAYYTLLRDTTRQSYWWLY
ncbi:MAG: SBBP repeat-containing protein [Bacteroidota bacterium]